MTQIQAGYPRLGLANFKAGEVKGVSWLVQGLIEDIVEKQRAGSYHRLRTGFAQRLTIDPGPQKLITARNGRTERTSRR
jgi:hypothetical protein